MDDKSFWEQPTTSDPTAEQEEQLIDFRKINLLSPHVVDKCLDEF